MKWSKRRLLGVTAGLSVVVLLLWITAKPLAPGLAYSGETDAEHVELLIDETWVERDGVRRTSQEIYDAVFEIIDEAEEYVLLDFFLVNDFLYEPGPGMRPLSRELADRLTAKRKAQPDVPIVFITDPINTVYGAQESPLFTAMEKAGVRVIWTDLDQLRDSNPIYSKPWRLLIRPWGIGPGDAIQNPLGEGCVSMRSILKLFNFKANHRKLVVTEKTLLVTSANPHSASSAHWNVALRVDGAGQPLALASETAIANLSGEAALYPDRPDLTAEMNRIRAGNVTNSLNRLELLTERKIKEKVIEMCDRAEAGARIDLSMFYLADRDVIAAILRASKRECDVRVILDPNKDAFGRTKTGIPNRQTAARLVKAGIPLRWADTHGEQFHVKMFYVEYPAGSATLLLGSCNFTRRNFENYNAECSVAFTALLDCSVMVRARETFDRWWNNPEGRIYTAEYQRYADPARGRMFKAWLMEVTGMSSF